MSHVVFLKGFAVGFSIAAPVGPIGILCIRRSLKDGAAAGIVSGMGAATADAAYGCVAAFGLTVVSGLLVRWQSWLGLGGGVFLCYLGIRTFLSKPSQAAAAGGGTFLAAYGSTFLLTLSNPATILSFVAVFAGLGLGASDSYRSAAAMVLGVFTGSAAWWLILCLAVGLFRSRMTPGGMLAINRVSGCILVAFGIYALGTFVLRTESGR
jgi:threonine/homoserine/homoserine lactone efflux protein